VYNGRIEQGNQMKDNIIIYVNGPASQTFTAIPHLPMGKVSTIGPGWMRGTFAAVHLRSANDGEASTPIHEDPPTPPKKPTFRLV
jgi:hypothetical protein